MPTATIIIKDEVNIKIEGLELNARKALSNAFKYDVPGARYLPAVRLGRWDGKISYFQLGGSTFVNLLPEIIPILEKYNYDIELDDRRDYSTTYEFELVTESAFSHLTWGKGHPMEGQPIVLRDYQVEIINNFLKNPQCIQEVATGAGKTIMTAALSQRCEQHGRTIVIVPNKSLVTQTEKDYRGLGLDVGVFFGDRKEFGKTHTICTWQSLNVLLKNTKNQTADITIMDFLEDVVCVMVDECFTADSKVLTPLGYVAIKDIKAGDTVINYSENTKEFKTDIVVKQHINLTNSSSEKMYELEFDNGSKIQVTGNHKFLTKAGWVRADMLTENHDLTTTQQEKLRHCMKLIKKTEIIKPAEVYNLHIENDHNYVVDGAVVSNCHMAKADALKNLMTTVMSKVPIRWGLTGTVPKEEFEFQALKVSLGLVINRLSASELQDRGVLAQCHVNIVQLVDHAEFTNYQSELKFLLEDSDRLKIISDLVAQVNLTGNTLVLVDRVAAGHALVDLLGERAVFVSGATKGTKRDEEYGEVATSDDKIIVATYGVAAVGINIPRIFNLVLLEPGKSFVRVIQSIGRGIRKAEDKDFVQIWDVTSTCKFAKRHLTKRKQFYKEANYPFTQEKLEWK